MIALRVRLPEKNMKNQKDIILILGIYLIINIDSTSCQSLVTVAATVFL